MEILVSPLLVGVLDLIARVLVSKGIIDNASKDVIIESVKTVIAGILMIVPSIYTIYKTVELQKHRLTTNQTLLKVTTDTQTTQPKEEVFTHQHADQNGVLAE